MASSNFCDETQLSCVRGTRVLEADRSSEPWASSGPCIMGIDEAGRGPVLGPMVYAAVYAPQDLDLSQRDFADSKTLSAEKRDKLFNSITADTELGCIAEILSAHFISTNMLSRERVSLNALAMNSTFKIIQAVLDRGVLLKHVYIDTVGDAERYEARLAQRFPSLQFTVCPKADALFPVVSAGSIIAKVVRDRALERIKEDVGLPASVPLGTGYPGDPDTKAWLKNNLDPVFGFKAPALVRYSWETCARLLVEGDGMVGVSFEADADADGAGTAGGAQQRISFAPAKQANVVETSAVGRHAYFRVRKLQRLGECF